ncbi:phosphoenolpyruvate synthase [Halanaerobiaceae bacterium Z-7014]|uniref:Phosphoenolpyruvate synthase n=1 Tax=Halonatronomonas betaini TaxID=2778430 RepID=A0A931F7Z9_9FIRM|nr:phosphoenolpyruvate synthase [Halonatronomonas betaini]MBF8436018.1 phosphoenolpyruvate synthase [Halonatronomonas betaini]
MKYIKWFEEIGKGDINLVGGKGANLGELTNNGVNVPPGFSITAEAYRNFLVENNLQDRIKSLLVGLDTENASELQQLSREIRGFMAEGEMPEAIKADILEAYEQLKAKGVKTENVAVRSSATAEDLPDASFAGQQDTYLNISGPNELLYHVKKCWSSLWTARAIYYRQDQGFVQTDVALSVVVQQMVSGEKAGVIFTVDPTTGNKDHLLINSSWGLGEAVVSGLVTPDDYLLDKNNGKVIEKNLGKKIKMIVEKGDSGVGTEVVKTASYLGEDAVIESSLTDREIDKLYKQALKIEKIYDAPQDIEWAIAGEDSEVYLLQSRPITTLDLEEDDEVLVDSAAELQPVVRGLNASPGNASGPVVIVEDFNKLEMVKEGDILVASMTNPDMVPAMRRAAAVVTDEGGRTCHAAIVSRELGIPCIVGCGDATKILENNQIVTVDSTRGVVFEGKVKSKDETAEQSTGPVLQAPENIKTQPVTGTKIYMNLGEPHLINRYKDLDFDGIGLMRIEFIFSNVIGAHPIYLLQQGEGDLFIRQLSEAITMVAQEVYPRPLTLRMSDFRTNEFRGLKGGEKVEPVENNPMIGWRGVSRYISDDYIEGFRLECKAVKKVRDEYNLTNVNLMLPFVRTTWEVERALEILKEEGLERNRDFKIWIMAEVPSVIFQAADFCPLIDGFSIGSNDLTQLIMGADRDSGILNRMGYFDERNPAIKTAIQELINVAGKHGNTVSICGQGPSVYPEFAEFLVEAGIDSISVNPDTVNYTRRLVAQVEQRLILRNMRK